MCVGEGVNAISYPSLQATVRLNCSVVTAATLQDKVGPYSPSLQSLMVITLSFQILKGHFGMVAPDGRTQVIV